MSELERIAYESALRALDKQEHVLEEVRARTGVLLGAASLVASLFGSKTLDHLHPLGVALVGAGALLVSLGSSLYVLLPRKGFVFAVDAPAVYEGLYEYKDDVDEIHRRLAYDLQSFWSSNDDHVQSLFRAFRLAVAALAVEIVALGLLTSGSL